mgnify:CR=1 FL=1
MTKYSSWRIEWHECGWASRWIIVRDVLGTAEDIADGLRNSAYECPIALACKRVGVPVPFVETDQVSNGVQGVPAPLPREARVEESRLLLREAVIVVPGGG